MSARSRFNGTPESLGQEMATNVPTLEIVSDLDLCDNYRTRLQAFNDSSVVHLLHFGLSAPEERTAEIWRLEGLEQW